MQDKYIIREDSSILEALKAIDGTKHKSQTLFVVDAENRMVGTLTDGDIRRGLIGGFGLDAKISEIMHRGFKYVVQGEDNASILRELRAKQIFFVPLLDKEGHLVDIFNLFDYQNRLPIDAVLMAGGKGERLRPLTEKTPKPLLKVGEKAIIDYNIDSLISFGVKHLSVTVNYLHEQIEEHFTQPHDGILVNCVKEPKYLGTIGSIRFVASFFNDTILVMNSDLFTDINYEDFYLHFVEHNAAMSVAAVPYTVSVPYGIFDLEGRDIHGVIEKPTYNYYANAGIYLIKREMLKYVPEDVKFDATDLIETLVAHGEKVIRYPLNGTWIDIGNPQDFAKANDLVKHIMK